MTAVGAPTRALDQEAAIDVADRVVADAGVGAAAHPDAAGLGDGRAVDLVVADDRRAAKYGDRLLGQAETVAVDQAGALADHGHIGDIGEQAVGDGVGIAVGRRDTQGGDVLDPRMADGQAAQRTHRHVAGHAHDGIRVGPVDGERARDRRVIAVEGQIAQGDGRRGRHHDDRAVAVEGQASAGQRRLDGRRVAAGAGQDQRFVDDDILAEGARSDADRVAVQRGGVSDRALDRAVDQAGIGVGHGGGGRDHPVDRADIAPGEQFRFYSTVMNGPLSDAVFLQQARRDSCTVLSLGVISCARGNTPPPVDPGPGNGDTILNVRYVDQVYVQRFTENGYWNHCGPASVAMLLNYEGKEPRDVLYNRQATLDLVPLLKQNGIGATYWGMLQNTLRAKGLQIVANPNTSAAESGPACKAAIR
jgi:hypothetical protein